MVDFVMPSFLWPLLHKNIVCFREFYESIPSGQWLRLIDRQFPSLAKSETADFISGGGHRWKGGHDLFMDVFPEFFRDPPRAMHDLGHILLTDFPTKAGIPIPGCSQSGLGEWLMSIGIPQKYLSINLMDVLNGIDGGGGILFKGIGEYKEGIEGSEDLISAMSGDLSMNAGTFLDTFGEGSIELITGISTSNPLLVGAGAENILAGLVSAWKTYTYYIDPASFFSHSITAALLGGGISYVLNRNVNTESLVRSVMHTAGRSSLLGGLGAVSWYFSAGASLGFLAMKLGRIMAINAQRNQMLSCACSPSTFEQRKEKFFQDPWIRDFFERNKLVREHLLRELEKPSLPASGQQMKKFSRNTWIRESDSQVREFREKDNLSRERLRQKLEKPLLINFEQRKKKFSQDTWSKESDTRTCDFREKDKLFRKRFHQELKKLLYNFYSLSA